MHCTKLVITRFFFKLEFHCYWACSVNRIECIFFFQVEDTGILAARYLFPGYWAGLRLQSTVCPA